MSKPVEPRVIGEHIRRLRLRRHVSMRAFAAQTGFSPSFISQLENGQVSPSLGSLQKIAEALGVTLGEFFAAAWLRLRPGDGQQSRARIKVLLQRRIETQPLDQPNAGSVFRNPPGDHAARLIESCGLKGFAVGGAVVSPKHANFIVNTGGASAGDIEMVIERVQETVRDRCGVELEREVRIVGEGP